MTNIGGFNRQFQAIRLSDPTKKEEFKQQVIEAANDGVITEQEVNNLKTNFLDQSSGQNVENLTTLLDNLASEIEQTFPTGSRPEPTRVESASQYLQALLTDNSNEEPLHLQAHDTIMAVASHEKLNGIFGEDFVKELFGENIEKMMGFAQGVEQLTTRGTDYRTKALGLVKMFQSLPEGSVEKFMPKLQKLLDKAGMGNRLSLGTDGNKLKIDMTFVGDEGGEGVKLSMAYDLSTSQDKNSGTFSVSLQAGVFDKVVEGPKLGERNLRAGDFITFAEKKDKSGMDAEGYSARASAGVSYNYTAEAFDPSQHTFVREVSLNDLSADQKAEIQAQARELGLEPDKIKIYLRLDADLKGNVSAGIVLEAEEPASTSTHPRFHRVELSAGANMAKLAADGAQELGEYLLEKYAAQITSKIAAKVGVQALAGVSRTIPVLGQAITAWQVGWEVGRLIGSNVTIGDKTIDQHIQQIAKDAIYQGPGANDEARDAEFKAGVAALRNAYKDATQGMADDDPRKALIEAAIDVRIMALAAVSRPDSISSQDRSNALEQVRLLEQMGVLTQDEAAGLHETLANARLRVIDPEHLSRERHENLSNFSDQIGRHSDADELTQIGRRIVQGLRHNELSPAQAQQLFDEISTQLSEARDWLGDPSYTPADIEKVMTAIANQDQSGDDNISSNTLKIEVGANEWIETAKSRLREGRQGVGTHLGNALERGDFTRARTLIDGGIDMNETGIDRDTALTSAIKRNDVDAVRFLMENNADPNNNEALLRAVEQGNTEIIGLLLENGADVNSQNRYGDRPLSQAIKAQPPDIEVIRMLLDHGADVNGRKDEKLDKTPLMLALDARDPNNFMDQFNRLGSENMAPIVQLLLERGADPNATYGMEMGLTPSELNPYLGESNDPISPLLREYGAN